MCVMYHCELNLIVTGSNGRVSVSRPLQLPFAPFVGIRLTGLARCADWGDHPGMAVAVASWDHDMQRWTCELSEINENEPLADLLADLGHPWKLHEETRSALAPF